MAKTTKKTAVPSKGVKQPSFATLRGLLGKTVDDPAVAAVIEKGGKVKVSSDFVVAKEAGFDFSLDRVEGKKKKVLSTMFLFADGKDGHVGFADLPKGFAFAPRRELLGALPKPSVTWQIGPGEVPVETPDEDVSHDSWIVDGLDVGAHYGKTGSVSYFTISLPEDETGGGTLRTNPLHFATKPADAPPDAELVGMALLAGWAMDRYGLSAKHASTPLGKQFAKREITPRTFLMKACDKTLTTLDVAPELSKFLSVYTRNTHHDDDGARDSVQEKICKLLDLPRVDERYFVDDYQGSFANVVENPFHIPDSWEAVDRIAPVIDARLADYEATKFLQLPDLALYEKARKLRDAVTTVKPMRAEIAKITVDDKLAEELVALIDRPLTDKHVKEVITRAGMPVGKKIDQQANPALGCGYMGTKFVIDGKNQMGVDAVYFFGDKYKSYIRGIGAEIEFVGYPALIPHGLRMGQSRTEVRALLGERKSEREDYDHYELGPTRRLATQFADDKLVMVRFGKPVNY